MILDTTRYDVIEEHELQCKQQTPTNAPYLFWHGAVCLDKSPNVAHEHHKRYAVIIRWGNVGMSGHQSIKRFRSPHEAQTYFRGRLRDKAKKGYLYSDSAKAFKLGISTPNTIAESPLTKFVETDWDLFS